MKVLGVLIAMLAIILAGTASVTATTEHCPEGGTKIENGATDNDTVLRVGTAFCVKASTGTTGIRVADGVTTLREYLAQAGIVGGDGEGRDVSHYVTYVIGEPSPVPSVSPEPSVVPSASPEPSVVPSASPEPSVAPSVTPDASEAPAPSVRPSMPPVPNTDTAEDDSPGFGLDDWIAVGMLAFMLIFGTDAIERYLRGR